MKKKIFITSKIHYYTGEQDIAMIEQAVQNDLFKLGAGDKVIFKMDIIPERKEVELIFHRSCDYAFNLEKSIIDADAMIISGKGLDGFCLPYDWGNSLFGYTFYFDIAEFETCYKKSAVSLGGSRIKDIKTEIYPDKVILRLTY